MKAELFGLHLSSSNTAILMTFPLAIRSILLLSFTPMAALCAHIAKKRYLAYTYPARAIFSDFDS